MCYHPNVPRIDRSERLSQIADAALAAFSDKGFRLTQVSDIARLAGVSQGTIYLFAESKEALFWLALRRAMDRPLEGCEDLQLTAEEMKTEFALKEGSLDLKLINQGQGPMPTLGSVIREHWNVVSKAAKAINLVERCARDWPELSHQFYGILRSDVIDNLEQYLLRGANSGACREVPNARIAARIILETIAWFAMHRLGDADGRFMDPDMAREGTVDALLHAFGPTDIERNSKCN
jgi:AcrR family transcriptional regulator